MDANERRERAVAEAAEWWTQLQSGELSRTGREEFVDWLRESAVHVAEMLRIAKTHDALSKFEHWTRIATQGTSEEPAIVDFPRGIGVPGQAARSLPRKPLWIGGLAASAAAVTLATWLVLGAGADTIETERGERRELALADGSTVQVDPQTLLRVKFGGDARQIVLKRGRALFKVAKDSARPFSVEAGDTVIRALGTSFGVERQEKDVVITVAEGKVAITSGSAELVHPTLVANQQVKINRSSSAQPIRQVDSTRELAWAEGRLIFENHTVTEVVEQFNRYNRIQLQVADAALGARPVSGVFNASDPESFVAFIQTVTDVKIVRTNDRAIIIASAR